jgi:hypothetical protein
MGSMWNDPKEGNTYPQDGTVQPEPFDAAHIRSDVTQFPASKWGGDFKSQLALAEYARTNWWSSIVIDVPRPPGSAEMEDELRLLVDKQTNLRPARIEEILAQQDEFQLYLVAQLGIGRRSHPNTYLLLKIVDRVGVLTMASLKMRYNRVRPSHIYPRLFPPIDVPDHSSYPSGHALVSRLMAFAAIDVVPEMGDAPELMSQRISENREIAGLHFPSDTNAGYAAAEQVFPILQNLTWYKRVRRDAKNEWS